MTIARSHVKVINHEPSPHKPYLRSPQNYRSHPCWHYMYPSERFHWTQLALDASALDISLKTKTLISNITYTMMWHHCICYKDDGYSQQPFTLMNSMLKYIKKILVSQLGQFFLKLLMYENQHIKLPKTRIEVHSNLCMNFGRFQQSI